MGAGAASDEEQEANGYAGRAQFSDRLHADAYRWLHTSAVSPLHAGEYLGETVNFKTAKASYRAKRMATSKDEQLIFTGTHEAIVDPETWEKAQQMLKQRAQPHAAPGSSRWCGKVICARCGAPMYMVHEKVKLRNGNDALKEYFICSTHRKAMDKTASPCFANTFTAKALRALLTDIIRAVIRYALENEDDFLQRLRSCAVQPSDDVKPVKKRIAALERRVGELNRLLKKLYEDYALDRIPESRYDALSAEYEAELSRDEEAVAQEEQQLEQILSTQDNAERFLKLARRFRDCVEFTDEQLSLFTDRVIVHETVKDADGERSRNIEVILNFIGAFHIPDKPVELTPEEVKHEEALKKRLAKGGG